jgi:hyperosmotically inducible protein
MECNRQLLQKMQKQKGEKMIRGTSTVGRFFLAGVLAVVLGLAAVPYASASIVPSNNGNPTLSSNDTKNYEGWLKEKVRHELVMLPYLSVFDNLQYRVDGTTVTLEGQVRNATLRPDAENVVKRIEGVTKVVNNIEVLPLSNFDDSIRRQTYRAVYGFASLQRYSIAPIPSIHIIVKNGNVTLEGVVANEADKNTAYLRANGVANVFSVTNNLTVENKS